MSDHELAPGRLSAPGSTGPPPPAGQLPTSWPSPPVGTPGWSGDHRPPPPPSPFVPPEDVPLTEEGPGYDPGPYHRRGSGQRPWWGIGDALLMIPIMFIVLIVSFLVMGLLAVVEGVDLADLGGIDSADLPASMLVVPTLIQQAAWMGWPFVVSRWKGLGPARDWGWAFKPVDIGLGLGTAFIAMFAAAVVGAAVSAVVGLEDESLAENTEIISNLEGSPWLFALLFVVIIGAPFSEELLFRGLVMRTFQKRLGAVAGVVASVVFFVPLHIADGGLLSAGQIVLWASIATLGVVLALAALLSRRLAGPIIAHVLINAIGVAGALGWFDALFDQLPN